MATFNEGSTATAGAILGAHGKEIIEVSTITQLLIGPLAGLAIWFLPLGIDPVAHKAWAIAAFLLINWIAEPVDHAITAILGCYLFWALGVAKINVAFSGFVSSTPWFLLCALLAGEAASRTGLVKRIGYWLMIRFGASYSQLILGIVVLSFLLSFLIPSAQARVAVIAPMLIGIFAIYNLGPQSNIARGLFLILTYCNPLFAKMIMAGPAAILTRGVVEQQTGTQIFWSEWFLAFFPLTLVTIVVSWLVVKRMYPGELSGAAAGREYLQKAFAEMGPMSGDEKKALLWIGLAIVLWATDIWHNINPAIVMIGIGLILTVPRIGVLDSKAVKRINLFPIVFTAGALSMGNVLLNSKALSALAAQFVTLMEPMLATAFNAAATIYWGGFLLHLVLANDQSFLATSLPILLQVAQSHGYNPAIVGLIWAFSGGGNLFIYQSGVLVLGYSYGYFSAKELIKLGIILTLLEGLLLMVLVPLYWPLIGLNWIK